MTDLFDNQIAYIKEYYWCKEIRCRQDHFRNRQMESGNFAKLFAYVNHKYKIFKYEVLTADGYILTMFRVNLQDSYMMNIPNENLTKMQPILLKHGLGQSADVFFTNDYKKHSNIGFFYAKQGYDVWVANSRGNKYSSNHRDDEIYRSYFNFCLDDMAKFDIPAYYTKILSNSNFKKIMVFGHNFGTTEIFMAMSDETNGNLIQDKTLSVISLASIPYISRSVIKNKYVKNIEKLYEIQSKSFDILDSNYNGSSKFFSNLQ